MIALTALVFALSGSVAGADPPSWAHGHGHHGDGGPPAQGAPASAPEPQSSAPADPSPPPPPAPSPAAQPSDGQGPGHNPGHGGTPPGHGGEPPGHERAHGQPSPGDGAPSPAATPTPAPTPAVTPTQAPNAPAVTTPITAPPVAITPSSPAIPVVSSPTPLPGISISSLAIRGAGTSTTARGAALVGATTVSRSAFAANPLTTPLSSATPIATPAAANAAAGATTFTHRGQRLRTIVVPPSSSPATVIARFINRIPAGVWIALGIAIGLAAVGGGAAVALGRRARLRAGEVAAVTATALTDQLTGVLNRRGFTDSAERELERARRYGHPLALAYVDVRGLKGVNDTEGHLAGDRLLAEVALMLSRSARTHDLVGRIGGDELAVLLAEQAAPGASSMARRVREQVPVHRAALGLSTAWDVTIGTASFPEDGDTLDELLAAADRRMYEQRGIELAR